MQRENVGGLASNMSEALKNKLIDEGERLNASCDVTGNGAPQVLAVGTLCGSPPE